VSAAISPATGRSYGVQRVCRLWALPRSSFYHAVNCSSALRPPARRGPAPPVAEASLLATIKADLASSPFRGEGHRKVWARLRYGLGLRVGRNRVLRLMRENQLLSPYRRPPRPANDHDGTILTEAPDVLWGTMVQTPRGWPGLDCPRSLQLRGHRPLRLDPRQPLLGAGADLPGAHLPLWRDRARGVTCPLGHGAQSRLPASAGNDG